MENDVKNINLTEGETLRLYRERLGLNQKKFYEGVCSQYIGSFIEISSIISEFYNKKIEKKYPNIHINNLQSYEKARVLRRRLNLEISEVAKALGKSHVYVTNMEKGKSDVKQYLQYLQSEYVKKRKN